MAALQRTKAKGVRRGANNLKHQRRAPANWRAKGTRNGLKKAQAASVEKRRHDHDELREVLRDDIRAMRRQGLSYAAIAAKLTEQGHVTAEGKPTFYANTVRRLLGKFRGLKYHAR